MEKKPVLIPIQNKQEGAIKVILNGGHDSLDCAIVPFTFGFSPEIIEKKPTHVLIIDRTEQEAINEKMWQDHHKTMRGRRYFVDLSDSSNNFIEFYRSGSHNLLFVFYNLSVHSKKAVAMTKKNLTAKKEYGNFETEIFSYEITEGYRGIIGFCEKDIVIPSEFFSVKPVGAMGVAFHKWVNMWRRDAPTDDCDFRDRALRAFTYELVPRILYLLIWWVGRYMLYYALGLIATAFLCLATAFAFLCGWQFTGVGDVIKSLWVGVNKLEIDFPVSNIENNGYKKVVAFGQEIDLPITILGVMVLGFVSGVAHASAVNMGFFSFLPLICLIWLILQVCLIIETSAWLDKYRELPLFTKIEYWRNGEWKWYDKFMLGCVALAGILFLFALSSIHVVHSGGAPVHVGRFLFAIVVVVSLCVIAIKKMDYIRVVIMYRKQKIDAWLEKRRLAEEARLAEELAKAPKVDEYKEYLRQSYNMEALPTTITAATLPKAQKQSQRIVQVFRAKFWDTKAKICRPYES